MATALQYDNAQYAKATCAKNTFVVYFFAQPKSTEHCLLKIFFKLKNQYGPNKAIWACKHISSLNIEYIFLYWLSLTIKANQVISL